jgi:hypothetical protein
VTRRIWDRPFRGMDQSGFDLDRMADRILSGGSNRRKPAAGKQRSSTQPEQRSSPRQSAKGLAAGVDGLEPKSQKALKWRKLKPGNVIHESDCKIVWTVTKVDYENGLAIVKRTTGSERAGAVSAVLKQSRIMTMHRIEECARRIPKLKQGISRGRVKKKRRTPSKTNKKQPPKPIADRRQYRGVRNPPHQA